MKPGSGVAHAAALLILASTPAAAAKTLDIYFIDAEGGQAMLVIAPSGQTMLIDAGWQGAEAREARRIQAAMKAAGVKRIDTLLVTHFHPDHAGGVLPLAERAAIGAFLDPGPSVETGRMADRLKEEYEKARGALTPRRMKAGEKIDLKGVTLEVLSAGGELISSAGAANPACAGTPRPAAEEGEHRRSIGFRLTYGNFRLVSLNDLAADLEHDLVCPADRIGPAAVLVTGEGANATPFLAAAKPKALIVNNSPRKAAAPPSVRAIAASADLWQLHFSYAGGQEANAPDAFIANLIDDCQGKHILLQARQDGSFTITNSRQKYAKSY
ncbi:MAG: MBL fold metallo-hydrolase [Bryobacteraceae bacterium]|nr:MBL fold metallo-hydrolase [Bryobacteraceae bacterium]